MKKLISIFTLTLCLLCVPIFAQETQILSVSEIPDASSDMPLPRRTRGGGEKSSSQSDATLVKSPISDKLTWVAGNGAWRIMYYDADLKALFTELNKAYFGGCVKVLSIGWNCDMQDDVLASTWYYRDTKEITMTFNYNLDHLKDIKTLKAVMLHEMCHAVQYMVDPDKTDLSKDAHKEEIFLYEKNRLIKYFNEWVW